MPRTSLIPKGIPLTESMPFAARDGVQWLAYIEGAPPENPWGMWYRSLLPGRRLRFDSAGESRVTSSVPPGAPFLPEPRLQVLLESARPLPPDAPDTRSRYTPWRRNPIARWLGRAADVGDAVRLESVHRWRLSAPRRTALRYQVRRQVEGAVDAVHGLVAGGTAGRSGAGVGGG